MESVMPAMVQIKNTLPQAVTISVLDDMGVPQDLKIPEFGTSEPIAQSRLTDHTTSLANRGHIRIRQSK